MTIAYRIIKIGSRFKYKLRHHRGHGIHSPFVFNFINDVIEEKYLYYAYSDIAGYLKCLNLYDPNEKKNQLIFRIINRLNPDKFIILDSISDILSLYIKAVSKNIEILNIGNNGDSVVVYKNAEKSDHCLFFDLKYLNNSVLTNNVEELFYYLTLQSFIIVDNIRLNRQTERFWKQLVKNHNVRVSLDLYYMGILFFDTKYYKQHYKLSF